MPRLQGKGIRLSSSRDVWTWNGPGEAKAHSRDRLCSPSQTSSLSWLPGLRGQLIPAHHATGKQQHHQVRTPYPAATWPDAGKNSSSCLDAETAKEQTPPGPCIASPVQQELHTLAEMATAHELCISICKNQPFNRPGQTHEPPVN